ncbi:MAG: hypothetical protein HN704_07370 [Bacteroidetes bacterium]|jgi:hypothetical protein|nr:hypothetical protein [Bacteroidota bacterium]MBT6687630.1 hypothetical protein [Bacteroidota bacterium]MBT7144781.1 hypothetical protein [Bacteroidota bacterium]MBT7491408.1 hypothetical protein [Bacteroidota bacterium]
MDSIEKIWEKGNKKISEDNTYDDVFIRESISKTSISITSKLPTIVWFGIAASLISALVLIYNIFFYLNNTPILAAVIFHIVVALSIFIFLIIQLRVINKMDTRGFDLHKLLLYKIKYFNTKLKLIQHSVALSIVLATFGLNLTMENNDGIFELNKILMLSVFYIFSYLVIIFINKFTHNVYLKQLRNALFNLEENTLISLDKELKKHNRIGKLIGFVIAIIFLIGLIFLLVNTGFER